jgi:hypothetical protein
MHIFGRHRHPSEIRTLPGREGEYQRDYIVFPDGVTAASRVRIAEFALSHHLPSVFGWKAYVQVGG